MKYIILFIAMVLALQMYADQGPPDVGEDGTVIVVDQDFVAPVAVLEFKASHAHLLPQVVFVSQDQGYSTPCLNASFERLAHRRQALASTYLQIPSWNCQQTIHRKARDGLSC